MRSAWLRTIMVPGGLGGPGGGTWPRLPPHQTSSRAAPSHLAVNKSREKQSDQFSPDITSLTWNCKMIRVIRVGDNQYSEIYIFWKFSFWIIFFQNKQNWPLHLPPGTKLISDNLLRLLENHKHFSPPPPAPPAARGDIWLLPWPETQ